MKELLELARSQAPKAIEYAAALLDDEEQDARVRLEAAKFLVSYGLGAPPKSVIEDDADDDASPLGALTPEQVRALAAAKLSREH